MTQKNPLEYFMTNVDSWGALQWFDRLVKAVRERDEASKTMVLSKDEDEVFDARFSFDIANNVASSSASRLVRDFEQQVREKLSDEWEFIGWQTRRKQEFLDKYPQASEFVMTIHDNEREARTAGLSTSELDPIKGEFPQELVDAVIIRAVYFKKEQANGQNKETLPHPTD